MSGHIQMALCGGPMDQAPVEVKALPAGPLEKLAGHRVTADEDSLTTGI